MGKQIVKWISNDGQEFDSERDMILHELTLVENEEIKIYCAQNFPVKKQKEYQRVIQQWNVYRHNLTEEEHKAVHKDLSEDLFAAVPQGSSIKPPSNYVLDDDELIEQSFKNATRI